jgi:hypothetical protein
LLGTWCWYEPGGTASKSIKILVDRHCHSKVMRHFEPNIDPESYELFAALEQALSE